jgi:hypothetical protein
VSPVFFTDRDLGKQFPGILSAAGLKVERFVDHFPDDCPDQVWLREIGKRGWVAITHDGRIRYKPNELAAVVENRVALLVVIGKVPFPELARTFVGTRAQIEAFLAEHKPPFIAKIHRPSPARLHENPDAPGAVSLWYPTKA